MTTRRRKRNVNPARSGNVAQIKRRNTDFQKSVQCGKCAHTGDDRFGKKAQMPKHNDQKRPVKHQAEKPEPFGAAVNGPPVDNLHVRIPEQGPKQKDLLGHSSDHAPGPRRVFHRICLDPGQRFLLTARCRNAEGNG